MELNMHKGGATQFGKGALCMSQLFAVRLTCEKYPANGKCVFWALMDLKEAYDMIDLDVIWHMLKVYGVGANILKAADNFYVDCRAFVGGTNGCE